MSGMLDSVIGAMTSQLSGPLGAQLGESPDAVRKGLETGSAVILGGMAKKADDPGIMNKLFSMATSANVSGVAAGEVPSAAATGDVGSSFISTILGSQRSSILDTIGRVTGLKAGSVIRLMTTLAPAVLGFLGSQIRSSGMNAVGFSNLLKTEAPSISQALPAGLNLAGSATESVAGPTMAKTGQVEAKKHWIWPAVIVALLLLAGLAWWRSSAHNVTETPAVTETKLGMAGAGDLVKRKLADGTELTIPRNGVEARLLDSFESATLDNTRWLILDAVVFDANSANLQPASREQLANVAAILKAYPNAHVKLGGYTDNAGDAAASLKLSQDRADSAKGELAKLGVAPDRVEAKGYGQEYPIADNSTEAGRQQNHRISMQVTSR